MRSQSRSEAQRTGLSWNCSFTPCASSHVLLWQTGQTPAGKISPAPAKPLAGWGWSGVFPKASEVQGDLKDSFGTGYSCRSLPKGSSAGNEDINRDFILWRPAQIQTITPGRQQLSHRALHCMRKAGDEQPGQGRAGALSCVQLSGSSEPHCSKMPELVP